jgi:hypothetical protein
MKTLALDYAKERIAHPYTEDELMPLLLFGGNWNMGKAQALYKIALLMMDAEILSIVGIKETTAQARDLLHMAGIHDYSKWGIDLRPTLNRIWNCPTVLALNPRLDEYIHWVDRNADGVTFLGYLQPIDRWSINSKRKWRYPYKKEARRGGLKKHEDKTKDSGIVIPEFYPFFTTEPEEERELLLWAHHLVPKGIPDHWRQDICQDLIVALLMGEVTKENAVSAVPKYIRKTFSAYPSKYGPLSLDQELAWDDDRTLLDKIGHHDHYPSDCEH